MTQQIGVGVVGFGLAGRVFHAPFISAVPGLRLVSIVERTGNAAAQAYPHVQIARSLDELLTNPEVQLVVVASPNATHFEFARQALNAGRDVVIDKPFTSTSSEARELIALAKTKGRLLAPFHNRRWDGDFLTLRKLLEEKKLGRLVTFESHFDRFRPMARQGTWKEASGPGHGLLFDLGPHLIDQAVALFGVPESLTASVRTDRENSAIEDAFDIRLDFGSTHERLTVWCRSTMIAAEPSPRFLLHGTHGSFRKFGVDPQEPAILAGRTIPMLGTGEWLGEEAAAWGTLTLAPDPHDPRNLLTSTVQTLPGDYRLFYANVRDALHGEVPLAVSAEDGATAIYLLELARESSRIGRTLAVHPH